MNASDVARLAEAACIRLAPEECKRIAAQLDDILEQLAPLTEFANHDEARSVAGFVESVRLRPDEPGADPMLGRISRFAPEVREGFFTVPRVRTHEDHA